MTMTKDDIKKAIKAYKGKFPNEYGWKCYSITNEDGTKIAYITYEKKGHLIRYKMYEEDNYIIVSPLYGGNSKKYKIDDCSEFVILCLLQWMRDQIIPSTIRIKRHKNYKGELK